MLKVFQLSISCYLLSVTIKLNVADSPLNVRTKIVNKCCQETRVVGPDQVLRGAFEQQRYLTGFDRPVISRGRFVVAGDRGVLWRTEHPFAFDLVITPNSLLQIVPGEAPSRPMAGQGGEVLGTFADILRSGRIDHAPEGFEIAARSAPQGAWSQALTPISGQLAAQLKSVTVSGSDFVDKVEILRANGDRDLLTFFGQAVSEAPLDAAEIELFSLAAGNADAP